MLVHIRKDGTWSVMSNKRIYILALKGNLVPIINSKVSSCFKQQLTPPGHQGASLSVSLHAALGVLF